MTTAGVACRYLQEVSNRLFSEGLHAFGREPSAADLHAYLHAYTDGRLPDAAVDALAAAPADDLPAVVQRLERQFSSSPGNGNGAGALLCCPCCPCCPCCSLLPGARGWTAGPVRWYLGSARSQGGFKNKVGTWYLSPHRGG